MENDETGKKLRDWGPGPAKMAILIAVVIATTLGYITYLSIKESGGSYPTTRDHIYPTAYIPGNTRITTPEAQLTPQQRKTMIKFYSLKDDKVATLPALAINDNPYYGVTTPKISATGNFYIAESERIVLFDIKTEAKTEVYKAPAGKKISYFDQSTDKNYLYITLMNQEEIYAGKVELYEYNLTSKENKLVTKQKPVFYGNLSIVGRAGEKYVIGSFGGDGCGGWGTIWHVENEMVVKAVEIGAGCSNSPRFLGFDQSKNSLILASIVALKEGENYDPEKTKYDKLYYQDVVTGTQETILDLMSEVFTDWPLSLAPSKSRLALIRDKKLYIYDLSAKRLEKTIDLEIDKTISFSGWPNENELYFFTHENSNSKFYRIDLESGVKIEVKWPQIEGWTGPKSWGSAPSYIGDLDNTGYFFMIDYQ